MSTENSDNTQSRANIFLFCILAAIALLIGLFHASSLNFINDDAFISFRYAKNFVHGLGLVYNEGERVEGYTNFLWTILIAFGMILKIDPVPFTIWTGIFFYACNIILFSFLSWRFRNYGKEKFFIVPLTALALCLHHDFNAYATSGLETSMFTFLISAGFCALLLGHSSASLLSSGMIFVLSMMTRPDGILFLAASCFYLLLTQKQMMKSCAIFLTPSVFIFLPYWLWRYNYYGYFFPNTFYAKSINLPYYSQGFEYAFMYLKTYYVFLLIPILGIISLLQLRGKNSINKHTSTLWSRFRQDEESHPVLLGLLYIIAYTLFIIRIGGDFMFARFFIPITPLLFFVVELLINKVTSKFYYVSIAIIVIVATLFRFNQFGDKMMVGYIADEARFYTKEDRKRTQQLGATFRKYFKGLPVKVAFWGGQLQLIYYADPPIAIESMAGLTDTTIAHMTIVERGRPGHEKSASLSYLIRRGVHFFIGPSKPPPLGEFPLNAILFDSLLAQIVVYDNTIMSKLAQYPEVKFVYLPEYLDGYISEIHTYSREKVGEDYEYFKTFYFDHNHDPEREKAILSFLGKQGNREKKSHRKID